MNAMNFPTELVPGWEDKHARLFGEQIIILKHRLVETGMFERDVLARLIESCPKAELGLEDRQMRDGREITRLGSTGAASGSQVIEAIERGRLWMNLRRVMDWAPGYAELLDRVFSEFENRMPGFSTFKRNIGILISSPGATVPYHADIQGQSLWQISGSKTVRVYPNTELFAPAEGIEKILLREMTEDLPYEPWFENYSQVIELKPGEMVTWPLYAPHRVDNGDMLSVSVTMEHWTQPIWNSYAAHYGNGVLRRTLGLKRGSTSDRGWHIYPKAAAAFAWKRLGRQIQGDVDPRHQFQIDPNSENGIVDLGV